VIDASNVKRLILWMENVSVEGLLPVPNDDKVFVLLTVSSPGHDSNSCAFCPEKCFISGEVSVFTSKDLHVCAQKRTCFSVNMNLCDFVVYLWTSSGSACNPEHWRQQNIYFRGCRGICNLCQIQSSLNWGSSIFLFVLLSWHEDVMHVECLTTDSLSKQ